MRFPQSFIDSLRISNPIEDVMSSYVELKRSGKDYVCSCPFHSEKTPSCHVFTDTQSFFCFGCQAGGDVITFIRLIEHYDYIDSVKFLAQRAGMTLPEDEADNSGSARVRLLQMNRDAARYFRDILISPEGREGLDYLYGRKLTPDTIRKYGLGFAPDGWHNLHFHLRKMGYTDDEMERGSLLVRRNNSVYDKFRRRVMFPIIDVRGNVIAFGGRTLEKDAPAKYLNSDETMVFRKRENLFSLNFAKNTREKFLILCEGYMDVISLNQAGFDSAVATLGTAITPQQANLMKRNHNTEEVIISYDADGAGQKATIKAENLLAEAGVKARVLVIPDAKDPDEYIKKFGAESFRHLIETKTDSVIDHEFAKLKTTVDLGTPSGKSEFLKKAVGLIAMIEDRTDRTVYISEAAQISGQQIGAVTELVADRRRRNVRSDEKKDERELIRGSVRRDSINPDSMRFPREERAERGIIAYMLHSPDLLPMVEKKLSPEDFPTEFNRRLFGFISEHIKHGDNVDITFIGSEFSAEETGRATGMCRNEDMLPYSKGQLQEYIDILEDHKARSAEKPVSELTNEDMLRKAAELREKMRK